MGGGCAYVSFIVDQCILTETVRSVILLFGNPVMIKLLVQVSLETRFPRFLVSVFSVLHWLFFLSNICHVKVA